MPALTSHELGDIADYAADRCRAILADADADTIARGRAWYYHAHGVARDLAHETGRDIHETSAVVAVLSPRVRWADNVTDADMLLRGELSGFRALLSNVGKAWDIIARVRPVDEIVSGPKVRRFWHNIRNPYSSHDVTLDVWMLRALVDPANLAHYREPYAFLARKGVYDAISDGVRRVADENGWMAHEIQAIVWIHVRGSHE